MKKLLEVVKHNLVLKIFSVILAILLWAFVQLVENPEISYQTMEIPITIKGEASLNNENLVISDVVEGTPITVTISAKPSYINAVTTASLEASVDVSSIKGVDTHTLRVNVHSKDSAVNIISYHPTEISMQVDHLATVVKPVRILDKNQVDKAFYIDTENAVISPSTTEVILPKSMESNDYSVVISLDIENVTSDINGTYSAVIVDKNGNEIHNRSFSILDKEFQVQVPVLRRKTVNVDIVQPAEQSIGKFTLNHPTVQIAVRQEDWDNIDSIQGSIAYDPSKRFTTYPVILHPPQGVVVTDENEILLTITEQ